MSEPLRVTSGISDVDNCLIEFMHPFYKELVVKVEIDENDDVTCISVYNSIETANEIKTNDDRWKSGIMKGLALRVKRLTKENEELKKQIPLPKVSDKSRSGRKD
jgi:hypothetical protein